MSVPSDSSKSEKPYQFKYDEHPSDDKEKNVNTKSKKSSLAAFLTQKVSFKVNKPLIPLKLSLFLWYGGGSVIQTFLLVFLKQRGLSIGHLSIINTISPVVQCLGPSISGVIADKLGKSKPVLFANLILVLLSINGMLLIPYVNSKPEGTNSTLRECNPYIQMSDNNTFSSLEEDPGNCTFECQSEKAPISQENPCASFNMTFCRNSSLFRGDYESLLFVNDSHKDSCSFYGVKITFPPNSSSIWCDVPTELNCNHNDSLTVEENHEDNVAFVFILTFILITFFNTTFSNCYRFMDVTSMAMVKTYNSDFGRERLWAVLSTVILSPLSGYLVEVTTPAGGTKNFLMAFYMFDFFIFLTMIAVWKLDVQIKPPGESMWKKTLSLLKDPDVLAFALAVAVLGTTWGFIKLYTNLYLDQLGATSMTFSLLPAVNSLLGLPFLMTSNWWVKKLGSKKLLLFAFLAYAINSTSVSYLVDPRWALLCEVTAIFTYHLLWVAVIRHSHEVAPEGLTATVISTAGGIHYGMGKGTGSLVGGVIMSQYGGRAAYRVIAIICATTAVFYGLFLFARWKCAKNFKVKETVDREKQNSQPRKESFTKIPIASTVPSITKM